MKKFFRNKMRFCLVCSILCLLAVVLFTTCSNPFNVQHKIKDKSSDGLASLRVSRLDSNSTKARSIMPNISMHDIENWKLELFQGNSDTAVYSDTADEIKELSILNIKPGYYTIVLSGYGIEAQPNSSPILQGQVVQRLKSGSNNVEMSLAPPRTENGRGNLSVSFDFSDSGLEGLILDDFEISMTDSESKNVTIGENDKDYNENLETLIISGSFPSGDYFLSVSLKIDEVDCELAIDPIVKIYDSQTSSKTFTMGKDTLQTIQNTRYVSKDGADGGAGLNPMSPWAWETAITWANENPSASNPEATRTLVLVEDIDLEETVEVKAPMALRSIIKDDSPCTLQYTGENLLGSGFIQVRYGTDQDGNFYYGSLTLEDITITAKANVSAIYGLVGVQSAGTSPDAELVLGSGAILTGHAGSNSAWGGGIYADKARVVLEYGSEISGNTAERGGAVSAMNGSTLVVEEGATISGNTADYGGAFYVDNSSKIVLRNTTRISKNTAKYGSGLCIEPFSEGKPQVYEGEDVSAEPISFGIAKTFFPQDNDPFALCLYYSGTSQDVLEEALTDDSGWPGLLRVRGTLFYETTPGNDPSPIEVVGTKAIFSNEEASGINVKDGLFSVKNKLYLDGITISGNETAEDSLIKVENGGTLVMRGNSKITGHKVQEGEGGGGGGVYVANGGTFTMDGGTIEGCFADMGAGVYVANGGTLNLNDGTIEQNVSSLDYGAGLYAESGASIALGGDKSIGEIVSGNGAEYLETPLDWQQAFIDAVINYEFDEGSSSTFGDLEEAVDKANTVPVRFAAAYSTFSPSITMTRGFELTGNLWLDGNITLYRDEKHKKAFFELTDSASLVLGFVTLSGKSGVNEQSVQDVKEALVVAKDAASVVLVNATLEYNTGGGLRLENTATLYVAGNGSINDNSAEQGAGIYLADKSSIVLELEEEFDGLIVFANTATLEGDYGYGGIYAEDSMGSWVEDIYPYLTDSVNNNTPKDHNLVASIPTATFSEQTIVDDSVYVLLSNEAPKTEEYIWKLINMPEELRTYRIPIVDDPSGYPPRDLAVYDDGGKEIPFKTLYTDNYRTMEIIFSHSGDGPIYLKDKNCIAFGIQDSESFEELGDLESLEDLRSYGTSYPTSYPTSFVVATSDSYGEKPFLGPSFYFGQTSSSIITYTKTFSVYNLSGNTISIAGDFANLTISGEESNDNRFSTENFPLNIPARGKKEFEITFGPNSETGWTEFRVDFTLTADEEEFVLEFFGWHS